MINGCSYPVQVFLIQTYNIHMHIFNTYLYIYLIFISRFIFYIYIYIYKYLFIYIYILTQYLQETVEFRKTSDSAGPREALIATYNLDARAANELRRGAAVRRRCAAFIAINWRCHRDL